MQYKITNIINTLNFTIMRTKENLYGALVAMGAGAYLVETEEEAQELMESIKNATICRELEGEEFETAKHVLDLNGHDVKRIYSLVNGSEFFVCLQEDWD